MNVEEEIQKLEEEIQKLVEEIRRLGSVQPDGSYMVTFGVLFNDDPCANIFEALVGTLRAAKKRKIVDFAGELLLQGVHDNVEITLRRKISPEHTQVIRPRPPQPRPRAVAATTTTTF